MKITKFEQLETKEQAINFATTIKGTIEHIPSRVNEYTEIDSEKFKSILDTINNANITSLMDSPCPYHPEMTRFQDIKCLHLDLQESYCGLQSQIHDKLTKAIEASFITTQEVIPEKWMVKYEIYETDDDHDTGSGYGMNVADGD